MKKLKNRTLMLLLWMVSLLLGGTVVWLMLLRGPAVIP